MPGRHGSPLRAVCLPPPAGFPAGRVFLSPALRPAPFQQRAPGPPLAFPTRRPRRPGEDGDFLCGSRRPAGGRPRRATGLAAARQAAEPSDSHPCLFHAACAVPDWGAPAEETPQSLDKRSRDMFLRVLGSAPGGPVPPRFGTDPNFSCSFPSLPPDSAPPGRTTPPPPPGRARPVQAGRIGIGARAQGRSRRASQLPGSFHRRHLPLAVAGSQGPSMAGRASNRQHSKTS